LDVLSAKIAMVMKYIVLNEPGGELPVIFARKFYHAYMADRFAPARVVSAGFVRLSNGDPECFGGSSSLGIASRLHRDSELIRRYLTSE
jgi:hypothetical protein